MEFQSEFIALPQDGIHDDAARRGGDGWRYVQMLAVNKDEAVDLVYSYMKAGVLENMVVEDVPRDAVIPSISDVFLEAFVCENEIHDLFGVKFEGIAIDFLGNFYRLSSEKPMTIISAEQLAEREKQKKIAAAKAAKAAKGKASKGGSDGEEDMEAKLASMDPEKAAKVKAAMEAKKKKEAAAKKAELDEKLNGMDPEKAAKVKAAMEAKKAKQAASEGEGE